MTHQSKYMTREMKKRISKKADIKRKIYCKGGSKSYEQKLLIALLFWKKYLRDILICDKILISYQTKKVMNTYLEKLLSESSMSERDKHDIKQIFMFVSRDRQQRILDNFEILSANIQQINSDVATEQAILFENLVTDLDSLLEQTRKTSIRNYTNEHIQNLKGVL